MAVPRTLVAVALAAVSLLGAATAQAATPSLQARGDAVVARLTAVDGDKRVALWKSLPPADRRAAKAVLVVDHVKIRGRVHETQVTVSPAVTVYCAVWPKTVTGFNGFGMPVWRITQTMEWCYDGTKIRETSSNPLAISRKPWTGTNLWFFDGWDDTWTTGGLGYFVWRGFSQGEFDLCIVQGVGCIDSVHPWIDERVYGDGNHYVAWDDE